MTDGAGAGNGGPRPAYRKGLTRTGYAWHLYAQVSPEPALYISLCGQKITNFSDEHVTGKERICPRCRKRMNEASGDVPPQQRTAANHPQLGDTWVHGSRLGRKHRSLRTHLAEDHGMDNAWLRDQSAGGLHGKHDGIHRTTWAYAYDLPHGPAEQRPDKDNAK